MEKDVFTIIFAITSLLDIAQQKAVSTVWVKKFGFIICKQRFINHILISDHSHDENKFIPKLKDYGDLLSKLPIGNCKVFF